MIEFLKHSHPIPILLHFFKGISHLPACWKNPHAQPVWKSMECKCVNDLWFFKEDAVQQDVWFAACHLRSFCSSIFQYLSETATCKTSEIWNKLQCQASCSAVLIQLVTLLAPLSALKRQTLDVALQDLGWMHGRDDGGKGFRHSPSRWDDWGWNVPSSFVPPPVLLPWDPYTDTSFWQKSRHQISSTMIWANRDRSRWPQVQSMKVHWLWQFDLDQISQQNFCQRLRQVE